MFEQMQNRLSRWWSVRETVRALRRRDDWILRDIGIEQSDLPTIRAYAKCAVDEQKC